MAKQPVLPGKELCSILEKDRIYRKMTEDGAVTVPIPVHSNKPLKKGTLHAILKKTGITPEKLIFLIAIIHSL